jgi:hypothetical protein
MAIVTPQRPHYSWIVDGGVLGQRSSANRTICSCRDRRVLTPPKQLAGLCGRAGESPSRGDGQPSRQPHQTPAPNARKGAHRTNPTNGESRSATTDASAKAKKPPADPIPIRRIARATDPPGRASSTIPTKATPSTTTPATRITGPEAWTCDQGTHPASPNDPIAQRRSATPADSAIPWCSLCGLVVPIGPERSPPYSIERGRHHDHIVKESPQAAAAPGRRRSAGTAPADGRTPRLARYVSSSG